MSIEVNTPFSAVPAEEELTHHQYSLQGIVTDIEGIVLTNVCVSIDRSDVMWKTSTKGNYRLSIKEDGIHTVRFKKNGFVQLVLPIQIKNGQQVVLDIQLHEIVDFKG